MSKHAGERRDAWKRILLATARVAAIAVPVGIGGLSAPLYAQSPSPATDAGSLVPEAPSVKLNTTGAARITLGIQPNGRFTATNVPLQELIRIAYGFQNYQLVGGPDWIKRDRFDIVAMGASDPSSASPAGGPRGPILTIVRSILAERFKLIAHTETRELLGYALVLARSDGQLGPQLRPAQVDCATQTVPTPTPGASGNAPAQQLPAGPPVPGRPLPRPTCGIRFAPGNLAAGDASMSQVASVLSRSVDGFVLDRTGVTGSFDLDLRWKPDQPPSAPAGAPGAPAPLTEGPSIFTAVEEQLGLKLASQWGPVDVLVIDSAERPTAD